MKLLVRGNRGEAPSRRAVELSWGWDPVLTVFIPCPGRTWTAGVWVGGGGRTGTVKVETRGLAGQGAQGRTLLPPWPLVLEQDRMPAPPYPVTGLVPELCVPAALCVLAGESIHSFDPRTTQALGATTLHTVTNPRVTYSCRPIRRICCSANADPTNHGRAVCGVFHENTPLLRGPALSRGTGTPICPLLSTLLFLPTLY